MPKRGPWIALASVVVVGVLATIVWPWMQRARHEQQLHDALVSLRGCLFGDRDDLSDDTLRRRAIASALLRDNSGATSWPARCGEHATPIEVALRALDEADPRLTLLAATRKAIENARFVDGSAGALVAGVTGSSGYVPKPVDTRKVSGEPLLRMRHDASALTLGGDGTWRLLLHTKKRKAVLCTIEPATAQARCADVPPAVPIAGAVLLIDGAPDAPPHVLARRDDAIAPEAWGIYDVTSGKKKLALQHEALGATVTSEGVAALVRSKDASGEATFFRVDASGATALPLEGDALGPPLMFGELLLWPAADDDPQDRDVVALKTRDETLTEVTGFAAPGIAIQACRSPKHNALLLLSDPPGHEPRAAVVFDGRSGWFPAPAERIQPGWFGFSCHDDGASLTWIEGDRITVARCVRGGCPETRAKIRLERYSVSSRYLVAALTNNVTVIWRSALGDVRFVVWPLATIADAPARSLFDDVDHGGFDWESPSVELLSRDGRALLLVPAPFAGGEGTFGFIVDDEGARQLTLAR